MTPANKTYIGYALVGLGIVLAFVVGLPAWDGISALNVAIEERQELIASRQSVIQRIDSLYSEYQSRESDVSKIESIVPSKKALPEIITAFQTIAQQNGMQLLSLSTGEISDPSSTEILKRMTFEITVDGGYIAYKSFLDSLEKNIRLVDIDEMSGSANVNSIGQINTSFAIRGSFYYIK